MHVLRTHHPLRRAALLAAIGVALIGFAVVAGAPAGASNDHRQVVDLTFPLDGQNTYIRDYDFCRGSNCERRHRATDIMAPEGRTIHAAVGGTISFITGMNDDPPRYGYMISIAGDDGRTYNYIHLGRQDGTASQAYAPGMARGVRVERGQHIGFNGCSGNASCTAPHLHFEIVDPEVQDPFGSNRLDPYDSLKDAEARGDVPGGSTVTTRTRDAGCHALVGDWDGVGRDGIGWWCDGALRLRTADGTVTDHELGQPGDVPVAGDWTGDGIDTVAIVRDGQWRIPLADGEERRFTYGRVTQGDVPIAGDWNASGVDTVGIIRDGEWHLKNSLSGGTSDHSFVYGRILQGDRPLIGDWSAAGRAMVGIVREGEWHLRYRLSGGPGELVYIYGRVLAGDLPVMGDWNGDGQSTPAIARGDEWHLRDVHRGGPADRVITLERP